MICSTVVLVLTAQAAARTASPALQQQVATPPAAASAASTRVVPEGEQYVVYDAKGAMLATYDAGAIPTILNAPPGGSVSCVQVKCPKALVRAGGGRKRVSCWKCGND